MRNGERGFTYLGLLVLVAVIGLMLASAGQVVATAAQRDREAQLLWVGHAYRTAIARYVRQRHAYPQALEDLLGSGPDDPITVRYIRRLYPDPMTGSLEWELITAQTGGILGVASRSKKVPIKTGGFEVPDENFADAKSYNDWKFTFAISVPAARPRKSELQ